MNLYLLIEESFRELSSRLLIAVNAVAPDCTVWVGQQWWFAENFARLPPGVVLFKGNNTVQVANMRRAKLAGHAVASIEEEAFGLAVFDGEKCYDDRAGRYCDLFCVQGDSLARFITAMAARHDTAIEVTGNPRADLLRPPFDGEIRARAREIRAERGDFVLVNTNFASINPFDTDVYNYFQRCVDAGVYDPEDAKDIANFDRVVAWEWRNLALLVAFLRRWPEAHGAPIVVRPHPSEARALWHETMAEFAHVDLVEDPDHLAWIAASRAMVHTSSTTGLEAYLLGTPSINLAPDGEAFSKHFLANIVNPSFADMDLAITHLVSVLQGEDPGSHQATRFDSVLRDHLRVETAGSAAARIARVARAIHPVGGRDPELGAASGRFVSIENTTRQKDKAWIDLSSFEERLSAVWRQAGRPGAPDLVEAGPSVFRIAAPIPDGARTPAAADAVA